MDSYGEYLIELLSWADSMSSLTAPTPRGAPTIDRQDVNAAHGGSRATLVLADGRVIADPTDCGPELLQLRANIGIAPEKMRQEVLPKIARGAVERLLSWGKAPNAAACHEAAIAALREWQTPGKRAFCPNRAADRARLTAATDAEHLQAAGEAIEDMFSGALARFGSQIRSARSKDWTRTPDARRSMA